MSTRVFILRGLDIIFIMLYYNKVLYLTKAICIDIYEKK